VPRKHAWATARCHSTSACGLCVGVLCCVVCCFVVCVCLGLLPALHCTVVGAAVSMQARNAGNVGVLGVLLTRVAVVGGWSWCAWLWWWWCLYGHACVQIRRLPATIFRNFDSGSALDEVLQTVLQAERGMMPTLLRAGGSFEFLSPKHRSLHVRLFQLLHQTLAKSHPDVVCVRHIAPLLFCRCCCRARARLHVSRSRHRLARCATCDVRCATHYRLPSCS